MKCKLGNFVESITDTSKIKKEKVILINTSDVDNGYVTNHTYVNNENLKGQFKKRFKKNDILYSEIRPKNKRFAYVDFEAEDYIASTKLMVLRNKGNIDNDFLFQLLKNDKTIDYLQQVAESRSGTFPQITFNELANLEVEIPSLEEQKNISKFLSNIDKKIKSNSQINETLLKICQIIYKEWFVNFQYRYNDGVFKSSEKGLIPKEWSIKKIKDIVDIKRGSSPRPIQDYLSNEGINWLKISDITDIEEPFIYKINEKIKIEGKEKSRFIQKGTLVVSNSATPGIPKFIEVDTCVHDGWLILQGYSKIYEEYLYFLLLDMKETLLKMANGSVFQNLKTEILREYSFIEPTENVINDFHNVVKPLMDKIKVNVVENINLEQLRKILLPKLMNGEIELKNKE